MRPRNLPNALPHALLIALLSAVVLQAKKPWEEKAYTEWTEKEVVQVLEKSPWAQSFEVVVPLPPQGAEVPRSTAGVGARVRPAIGMPLRVRWSSARTIREAWVRRWELEGEKTENLTAAFLSSLQENYVITVRPGEGAFPPWYRELWLAAYLEPEQAEEKISPARVINRGDHVAFYFPRESGGAPTLSPQETKVKFTCIFRNHRFQRTFDLRKMVRNGQPDL